MTLRAVGFAMLTFLFCTSAVSQDKRTFFVVVAADAFNDSTLREKLSNIGYEVMQRGDAWIDGSPRFWGLGWHASSVAEATRIACLSAFGSRRSNGWPGSPMIVPASRVQSIVDACAQGKHFTRLVCRGGDWLAYARGLYQSPKYKGTLSAAGFECSSQPPEEVSKKAIERCLAAGAKLVSDEAAKPFELPGNACHDSRGHNWTVGAVKIPNSLIWGHWVPSIEDEGRYPGVTWRVLYGCSENWNDTTMISSRMECSEKEMLRLY